MKAKLKLHGKEVVISDIEKMKGIGNFTGLMFKPKEQNALLFEFGKGRRAIHSCFCKPFLAIWLLEGKIIDYRIIKPFCLSIIPKQDFDVLIEVPLNKKYADVVNFFIDGGKI